ncbi:hypothetical protein ACGF0D_43075 [Kitasatospora sp. NPDC048298]|uniref:hypothetical protein n=1 Tax=Kitasatospora sp. NPDC048298 TaxID=3364049 RepID=UPI003714F84B
MSTKPINLPGLGLIHPTDETNYRADDPISVGAVRALIHQKWVHTVQVSDGQGGAPEFHASCELNGKSFTITGQIAGS